VKKKDLNDSYEYSGLMSNSKIGGLNNKRSMIGVNSRTPAISDSPNIIHSKKDKFGFERPSTQENKQRKAFSPNSTAKDNTMLSC
jgi:hypothetical protein